MSLKLYAIVGRPNVGKSTLFNRLTGEKNAIVDDMSGVTRDRNYGEVEWNNKRFRLIDTGGYVPASVELFETAIREQVEIAISESDAIIFLLDGVAGPIPVDQQMAQMLRVSGKKVIVVVNKIDSEKRDSLGNEFYELGLGDPFNISAINGRGTGELLDSITEKLDVYVEEPEGLQLKVALVGRPNVGKSSLTNAILGYDRSIVTDVPGTTRDSINSTLKYYGEEIILIDTAGLRKKSKIKENIEYYSTVRTLKAIADSTVSVVMLDATAGLENQDQKIIDEAVSRRKGLIIAVNKWDLVEKDSNTAKKFEEDIRRKLGNLDYIPIIFISALTKQRMYKVIDLAKEVHLERKKQIPTNELSDFISEITSITPPPASPTGREIKIKYSTQVGENYPVFLLFSNYPEHIPDSYRRYLEKSIRNKYGFMGVPFTMSFKQK
ncbi:MAG: ribosome biogenesis GTPase Der [Ignavibacteriaceae bacterium]|nr:ribosome biogenesis GTPase Der [Ignavibacteriaceae bacterium]